MPPKLERPPMRIVSRHPTGAIVLESDRHRDERGFLAELYSAAALAQLGIDCCFQQDNFSYSPRAFTVRGLHFQVPPHAQVKLVRALRGSVYTVAVDLRRGSPSYGQHAAAVLSAENWQLMLVPRGFAHGVLTLEPETELLMKLDTPFAGGHASGLAWDDPELGIPWPLDGHSPLVSPRDQAQPRLRDLPPTFE
jgi:dTDP-4-dehydrorhamnose 3,5-epimerase